MNSLTFALVICTLECLNVFFCFKARFRHEWVVDMKSKWTLFTFLKVFMFLDPLSVIHQSMKHLVILSFLAMLPGPLIHNGL